jgi:very-short-patch-repair endonuclease
LPQRNLIHEKLCELASENPDFASKLGQLEESGLFLKNLENLQGDERDVIIISTTFGETASGQFRRNFGPVQTRVGHRLLNVLITRAKEKIFVVSSIPNQEIDNFADYINTQGNRGKAIFYAYLYYARAVSNNDIPSTQRVLNVISKSNDKHDTIADNFNPESPFEEEVLEELLSNFSKEEINTQEQDSGFRIDIVIKPKDQPHLKIAIECDGATYHSDYDSYLYDLHRQNILERAGYKFIRIWSKKWFANSKLETKKLLKKVIELKYENNAGDKIPNYLIAEKVSNKESS